MAQKLATLIGLMFAMAVGHSSATWCVCKPGLNETVLQKSIDYACGSGADCTQIHQKGACYNPDTVPAHCNYAVNSYFQRKAQASGSCDFAGVAIISTSDPSVAGCVYPSSASITTTMARTRSGNSAPEGTPAGTTQTISSTMEIPLHSSYASTQGESPIGAIEHQSQGTDPPALQGTNPPASQGANSQFQQLHTPVNSRPVGYEYSTVVTTNPPYGMHLYPEVGGSGRANRSEAQGQMSQYIRGLAPIPEDQEFSGPYTERDSESLDDDVASRRRPAGKEPMPDGGQRPRSTRGTNPKKCMRESRLTRLRFKG
ncbi:hypothetical protein AgCh_011147 [Apium graveolens]